MNFIDSLPVPLGGSRVPESMGGNSFPSWEALPEQASQQTEGYGEACDAVVSLREQVGLLKKQLSGIAVPIKEYIYSSAPTGLKAVEAYLAQIEAAAAAIDNAAKAAAAATAADSCLDDALKAEAAKVIEGVRCDAENQAADCRALCLVTTGKADAQREKQQAQPEQKGERQEFAKELYGDFNLQLGPVTRKMFAAQTKLLALVKSIKKQGANRGAQDEQSHN